MTPPFLGIEGACVGFLIAIVPIFTLVGDEFLLLGQVSWPFSRTGIAAEKFNWVFKCANWTGPDAGLSSLVGISSRFRGLS